MISPIAYVIPVAVLVATYALDAVQESAAGNGTKATFYVLCVIAWVVAAAITLVTGARR